MDFADDIDERRRRIALFRYAVIADLDAEVLHRGELSTRIEELSTRTYRDPSGRERRFSPRTLWTWWTRYRRSGLRGLVPKRRSDSGVSREITPEIIAKAVELRQELPSRSTSTVIDILERKGTIPKGRVARSTLDRHLERAGYSRRRLRTLGKKRFTRLEFDRPNAFWVGDYHECRLLWDAESQGFRKVHLCSFIDHYSRFVVHAEWYSNSRIATLEDTFKKAILKRGLTDKVYVDNAKVYRSPDFAFAVDVFGIRGCHSKPYVSEGRGVIERWHQTLKGQFEQEARLLRLETVEEINGLFVAWLEERYHRTKHSSTGQAPLDRLEQAPLSPRYPDPVKVQDTFRVRVKRKVDPKTSTVAINRLHFLVETFLRSRWVEVHYDPHDPRDILVFLKGKRVQRAFPAKPNDPVPPPLERPSPSPPAFDYLAAIRADYDRRSVAAARHVALSDWKPSVDFGLESFLKVYVDLMGKDLAPYERDELAITFETVGPFSERTARLALEHAIKVRGRGLHVSVYTHYLKTFHLAVLRENEEKP